MNALKDISQLAAMGLSSDQLPVIDLGPRATKMFAIEVSRLMADRGFNEKLRAITSLKDCRSPSQEDLLGLLLLSFYSVWGGGSKRIIWEEMWAMKTEKTWEVIKDFPDRLIRMAKEIEKMNESIFFMPSLFVNGETAQRARFRERFSQLPGVMKVYAGVLRLHISHLPEITAVHFGPNSRSHGYPDSVFRLSELVKAMTGKPHDRHVADLLDAAARALGQEEKQKDKFSELGIAQARSRRKSNRSRS